MSGRPFLSHKKVFRIRNNTDYADFYRVSEKDAAEQYEKAKSFIEAIQKYLMPEESDSK